MNVQSPPRVLLFSYALNLVSIEELDTGFVEPAKTDWIVELSPALGQRGGTYPVAHCWGVSDPTVLAQEELCVDWHTWLRLYVYFLGQWKTWPMFTGSFEDSTWKVQLPWVVFQELEMACFHINFLSKYWRRLLQPIPFIWSRVVHLITTWLHFFFASFYYHTCMDYKAAYDYIQTLVNLEG